HALPGSRVGIEERAVPDVGEAAFFGDERGPADEFADDLIVFSADVVERWNMTLRHDEHMRRRLRVDVVEREHAVVLVDDARRYFSLDDFAEQAVGHGA